MTDIEPVARWQNGRVRADHQSRNDLPGSVPLSIRRQGNVAVVEGREAVGRGAAVLPVNCR